MTDQIKLTPKREGILRELAALPDGEYANSWQVGDGTGSTTAALTYLTRQHLAARHPEYGWTFKITPEGRAWIAAKDAH